VHTIYDSNVLYSNAAHIAMDESWHFTGWNHLYDRNNFRHFRVVLISALLLWYKKFKHGASNLYERHNFLCFSRFFGYIWRSQRLKRVNFQHLVDVFYDSNVLYSNAAHTAMDESWHFTGWNHLHDRILLLKRNVGVHTTSLTPTTENVSLKY
jgi:hypothetical protein